MDTAIMLFTRDLRVRDNPALAAACEAARHVVPLFVFDDRLLSVSPNRTRFLVDSLHDLRESLRARGGDLVLRRGDPAEEAVRLAEETGAEAVFLADDVGPHAARRRETLEKARVAVSLHPGVTVVPPGALLPTGGDHYKVFTPYWRSWEKIRRRPIALCPERVPLPENRPRDHAELETIAEVPALIPAGETAGRERTRDWLRDGMADYDDGHDDLAGDRTSRLGPYLRFGCVSPLELWDSARRHTGHDPFTRQLAWRDFLYQVTAAFPAIGREDYRPRGTFWNDDADALAAWREGRTGFPIVDAGMRQLEREGFMHNRARMITASFLTRNLAVDWRAGLAHFGRHLLDGDLPNNAGNWQWVAGTGNDTRPNRVLNPLRQAVRFDPDGEYVRRYVPELAHLETSAIHTPWKAWHGADYPAPITDPPAGG